MFRTHNYIPSRNTHNTLNCIKNVCGYQKLDQRSKTRNGLTTVNQGKKHKGKKHNVKLKLVYCENCLRLERKTHNGNNCEMIELLQEHNQTSMLPKFFKKSFKWVGLIIVIKSIVIIWCTICI